MSRYQFIEQAATTEPVQELCRVLRVSSAGYYQWRNRLAKPITSWQVATATAFERHARRYGTRRLRAELGVLVTTGRKITLSEPVQHP